MSEQDNPINNCSMCRFHDSQPVATPDGKPIVGQEQLVCRRFPPQVVALQMPTPQGMNVNLMPMFPAVNEGIWCHEFEPENGAQDVS